MCKFCYEHTRKVWYLQDESFDIRSGRFLKILPGRFREWFFNFLGYLLGDFIDESTADVNQDLENREPYTGLKNMFYNYFAKNILGGQVASSLDHALQVLDKGEDFYLTYCSCKRGSGAGVDFRCIYVNHNARVQRKLGTKDSGRFINKDEAREIILEHRKDGHFNTVMWGLRPKVDSICNCDYYCGGLRVPEIRWGLIPSMNISRVGKPDLCDSDCDICVQMCHAKAIKRPAKGQVVKVNENKCIGCNICIKNCPYGVFEAIPRKIYYDAIIGKKVKLKE